MGFDALSRCKGGFVRSHHCYCVAGRRHPERSIASLPLVSLLGIVWLWHDTSDTEQIATFAQSTFWYVLPTLPMFF